MAKNLGGAVIGLLAHDRVELRAAAVTVLAAVGRGDDAVEAGLIARLADVDPVVRRLALEALVDHGATGLGPHLVAILKRDDDALAERAAELLAANGAGAEAALRKELGHGPVAARRVIAQLLVRRGTAAAIDALLDQLADHELGEQVLQLVRHELDAGDDKLAELVYKAASGRVGDSGKRLHKELARVAKEQGAAPAKGKTKAAKVAAPRRRSDPRPSGRADPRRAHRAPAPARLSGPAAVAGLAGGPGRSRAAAPGAVRGDRRAPPHRRPRRGQGHRGRDRRADRVRRRRRSRDRPDRDRHAAGARIPEKLAKAFAALAKSKNPAAQKLAMERLPAGGGAGAVKALIDALGGDDVTARDAAARGLAKAPEAVLPLTRALLAATDEQVARRYAGALARPPRPRLGGRARRAGRGGRRPPRAPQQGQGRRRRDPARAGPHRADRPRWRRPSHVELLFEYARRLRKAGKPGEAFAALKPLLRTRADLDAAIDDDARFFLAVLGLTVAGNAILRASHADDPVLAQFGRLARAGYAVAKKLAKDKDVSDEEIYGLGFRLLESPDGGDQELGAELLGGIIEERPRSKLAKAAKNKLKLTGHLDD
jgi:hypothetical protein